MARTTSLPSVISNPQPGMFESLQNILRAITEYFVVRFEMAGIESKTASIKIAKAVALFAMAVISLAAGFLYLSLSLVYVLAEKVGWGWGWALLVSGLVMLIVTVAGLIVARNILRGEWFPTLITELKKDAEWLKTPRKTV